MLRGPPWLLAFDLDRAVAWVVFSHMDTREALEGGGPKSEVSRAMRKAVGAFGTLVRSGYCLWHVFGRAPRIGW